jgi:cell wall-associated NlpC family hydrolase
MARYTAEQIYAFAREAGFSPDRAATMTAIAMAESRGNSTAHNPVGENSKGLWQINQRAHPQFANMDLFDPVQNAKAAFQVSHGGDDISPWTTTHGGGTARYLRFRADAEAAAAAYGDGPGRGMWTGVSGYGDHTSAGDVRGGGQNVHATASTAGSDNVNVGQAAINDTGQAPNAAPVFGVPLDDDPVPGAAAGTDAAGVQSVTNTGTPGAAGAAGQADGSKFGVPLDNDPVAGQQPATAPAAPVAPADQQGLQLGGGDATKLQTFLTKAVAQSGDRYVFGAETKLDDPNPGVFDCSELVEWASHQAGVKMPDGAWNQYRHLAAEHSTMSVEQAIHTPGALLFSFDRDPMTGKPGAAHVAISLGNGKTIEAKGTQYGVGSWEANTRRFQYAGMIPEMSVGSGGVPAVATQPHTPAPQVDAFAHRVGNDPAALDNHPATIQASHVLTAAEPPPAAVSLPELPPQPADPHVEAVLGDADQDGNDDALAQAMSWTAPDDDPNLHPHADPHHDDSSHHDGMTGHAV